MTQCMAYRGGTVVKNILTMIKEPNDGHDALLDFKETGKKGVEVGETVWQVVQEKKMDDGSILLAQAMTYHSFLGTS